MRDMWPLPLPYYHARIPSLTHAHCTNNARRHVIAQISCRIPTFALSANTVSPPTDACSISLVLIPKLAVVLRTDLFLRLPVWSMPIAPRTNCYGSGILLVLMRQSG